MSADLPPPEFARAQLALTDISGGIVFRRIYRTGHSNALGYGKTGSRFSDPRPLPEKDRFGVLYLGESVAVCFLEAVLRDRRNGTIGTFPISEAEIDDRRCAQIEIANPLRMVELRGNALVRMGVPTDVPLGSSHDLSRPWSLAFHEHPDAPDGIVYPSRLNGQTNLAIYDRAIPKLRLRETPVPLKETPEFPGLLDEFDVALV
jgi:hypothetical protein